MIASAMQAYPHSPTLLHVQSTRRSTPCIKTNTKPIKRIFAVSKRDDSDKRKADWIEIGAEWPTSNPDITRISRNDAFVPLPARGNFDIVLKAAE